MGKTSYIVGIQPNEYLTGSYRINDTTLVGGEAGVLSLRIQNNSNRTLVLGDGFTVAAGATSVDILSTGGESPSKFDYTLKFPVLPDNNGTVVLIYSTYNS